MSTPRRAITAGLLVGAVCLPGVHFALAQGLYNLDEYEKTTGKKIGKYNEALMLRVKVAAGELPPVEKRLPENPLVMEPWEEVGKYGGTLRYFEFTAAYCHYLQNISNGALFDLGPSSTYPPNSGTGGPIR